MVPSSYLWPLLFAILNAATLGTSAPPGAEECSVGDCDDVELLHLKKDQDLKGDGVKYAAFQVSPVNSAVQYVLKRMKGKVALAMRGGGARSMAGVTGQMRALQSMGLLDKVDQIVSISGTTWATAPYLFAKGFTSEELLGTPTDPSTLNDTVLATPNGGLSKSVTTPIAIALTVFNTVPPEEYWIKVAGATWLCAFNLQAALPPGLCPNATNQVWAETEAQLKSIGWRNRGLDLENALTIQKTHVSSYVISTSFIAPTGYQPEVGNIVASRLSPDMSGSPFFADHVLVNFTPINTTLFENLSSLEDVVVGGGLVESFAYLATNKPLRDRGQAGKTLLAYSTFDEDNTDNAAVLTLQDAVGIASNFFVLSGWATLTRNTSKELIGAFRSDANVIDEDPLAFTARRLYWPVSSKKQGDTAAREYYIGDAASHENHGILEAIRSGAECIIALLNSNQPIDDSVVNCTTSAVNQTAFGASIGQSPPLYDLFGFSAPGVLGINTLDLGGFDYSKNTVFAGSDMFPILCEAIAKRDAGAPATVASTLTTVENKFWGIEAGQEVHIVWVFTEKTASFESLLPQTTQDNINDGVYSGSSELPWPYLDTTFPAGNTSDPAALSQSQSILYAAQTEWSLLQIQEDLETCFGKNHEYYYSKPKRWSRWWHR